MFKALRKNLALDKKHTDACDMLDASIKSLSMVVGPVTIERQFQNDMAALRLPPRMKPA